jgi:NACHT domain
VPSPEELLADWGIPVGLVMAVVIGVWLIRTWETLAKPLHWLWVRFRPHQGELLPDADQLAKWETHLRFRMRELWVSGERAPLRAAEREAGDAFVYLHLETDDRLLHPSHRSAVSIETGQPIEIADDLLPGDLFEVLDSSVLIVGGPGAGKSVLLWQILRQHLSSIESGTGPVPVLIELHRWKTLDTGQGTEPSFEDFIVSELAAPAIGLPEQVTRALVGRDRLTYLLDGLDELPSDLALRCLNALSAFAAGPENRTRQRLAVTCRTTDYGRMVREREAGTAAVRNALRITPHPPERVRQALRRADPPPGRLPEAATRLPALETMLGTPLWLTIAVSVYRADRTADPLSALPEDTDEGQIVDALYPNWLALRLGNAQDTPDHLRFLAAQMRSNSQQTLYLEMVQPSWLGAGLARSARIVPALAVGLLFVLVGLFVELSFWIAGGLPGLLSIGLSLWLPFWIFGLFLMQAIYEELRNPLVIASRKWSWRAALRRQSLGGGPPRGRGPVAAGLVSGLLSGLVVTLAEGGRDDFLIGLIVGGIWGLSFGLGMLLVVAFSRGWVTEPAVEGRTADPFAALSHSTRVGMSLAVAAGLLGLATGLLVGRVIGGFSGSYFGLFFGLAGGLMIGLARGLGGALGYLSATMLMARRRLLPFRLDRFLQRVWQLGILYPVGPGYRFRHRTLADYLAEGSARVAGIAFDTGPMSNRRVPK